MVVSSIAVFLNAGSASWPSATVSPQPAPSSALASPISPVWASYAGKSRDAVFDDWRRLADRTVGVAFEVVLADDRYQHLV